MVKNVRKNTNRLILSSEKWSSLSAPFPLTLGLLCCLSPGGTAQIAVFPFQDTTSTYSRQSSCIGWGPSHPDCLHMPLMFDCPATAKLVCHFSFSWTLLWQTLLLRALGSWCGMFFSLGNHGPPMWTPWQYVPQLSRNMCLLRDVWFH